MADQCEREMFGGVVAVLTGTQRAYLAALAQAPPDPIDPQHRMLAEATRALFVAHGVFDGDGYLTAFGVRAGLVFADQGNRGARPPS